MKMTGKAALWGSLCVLTLGGLPAFAQESVLHVAINAADIVTLDPHRATTMTDKGPVGWLFNGLVRFPPGSADPAKLEPDLAESWTSSPDGKEWVFKLRQGVKFHGDWGEVTADDVVYSLERAKDPERSSFAASYEAFKTIEAVDPHTVRIVLDHPVAGFLGLVANYHGGNIVSKKAAEAGGADFGKKPVGTGPFEFVQHTTQQNVTFEKNPDYFRGEPQIDQIDYRLIPQDSSRELAFSSGELHLIAGKREQRWVERWREQPGAIVDLFSPGEYRMLHLNTTIAPLDDHRVREAIARAINIDDIVAFVGPDVGPKGCSVVPTGYIGADCTGWDYPHDIEKAKALLAEAGHPDGITIKSVVSSATPQLSVMEVIQAQLAEAGITLEMQVVDHPTYHDMIRKDVSGVTFYGSARYPIADSFLTEFFDSDAIVGKDTAITNFSHCDVADKEIEAARTEIDSAKQLADWSEAQKLIHQEICAIPLFTLQQVWLQSDKLDLGYKLEGAMNLAPPITEASVLKTE